MSDFEFELDPSFRFELDTPSLRVPRRSSRPSLGVPRLRLDPEVQSLFALRRAGTLLDIWTCPDASRSLEALIEARLTALGRDLDDDDDSDSSGPRIRGGQTSPEPRRGKPGDLFNAIWRVPQVQNARERVLDEATSTLRRGWRDASTPERVLLVSHVGLISGAALTAILSNDQTRPQFLRLMSNIDIPVPLVDGMSFRVNPEGASFRIPLGAPGLTGHGSFSIDGNWEGRVTFDLAAFLRSRPR